MSFGEKFIRSNFVIKLRSWEYWPFGIVHFPVFFYYMWLSLRARSFLFFSASNPGIVMGGMFGESKFEVLKKVPSRYVPHTTLVPMAATKAEVLEKLTNEGLRLPVIFKPDLGERGYMVNIIESAEDIDDYLAKTQCDFLIQELVSLPLEFGVFYARVPCQNKGSVTSIVVKEMLRVVGDGTSSLQHLILQKDRAKLQWDSLKNTYSDRLSDVLKSGETLELVSIGNHCLGTTFLDGSHLINRKLSDTFDSISQQIDGFYFGRFDLRCATIDDLYEGNIMIMELNGCGAEPGHIYQPGFSLRRAISVLIDHWRNIFIIARENTRRGATYTPFADAVRYYRRFRAAVK